MVSLCVSFAQGSSNMKSFRIVGGTDALHSDAPFAVSLQYFNGHFCGGSLIAKNWVLTAAHCLMFTNPDHVVIGSTDLENHSDQEIIEVESVVSHPLYDPGKMSYDFALVKLKRNSSKEIISLATKRIAKPKNYTVVGWGNTQEGGQMSSLLQKILVPEVDSIACNEQLQNYFQSQENYIDETMICAGYLEGGIDACQADSGGPMYFTDSAGRKVQVGIVSWGIGCARKNLSGIYARVSHAIDWINQEIAE